MFGNGKVRKLEMMMAKKNDEIYRLKQQLSSEGKKIDTLVKENNTFKKQLNILMETELAEKDTRDKEISTLKKQLRKQNSADILVNAFEAVGIIPTDKKKDYPAEQCRLLALQQQYDNGGLFGLGSIF